MAAAIKANDAYHKLINEFMECLQHEVDVSDTKQKFEALIGEIDEGGQISTEMSGKLVGLVKWIAENRNELRLGAFTAMENKFRDKLFKAWG